MPWSKIEARAHKSGQGTGQRASGGADTAWKTSTVVLLMWQSEHSWLVMYQTINTLVSSLEPPEEIKAFKQYLCLSAQWPYVAP